MGNPIMKLSAIFQRIALSSLVLSPLIGSSAFVVSTGRRSHRGQQQQQHQHQMYPSAIATTLPATTNEENFEFDLDFIAAATEAAVESSVAYVLGMRSHEGASTATAKATAYAEGFD